MAAPRSAPQYTALPLDEDGGEPNAGAEPSWLSLRAVLHSPRVRTAAVSIFFFAGFLAWVGTGGMQPLSAYVGRLHQTKDELAAQSSTSIDDMDIDSFIPVDGGAADSQAGIAALPQDVDATDAIPPPPPVPPPALDAAAPDAAADATVGLPVAGDQVPPASAVIEALPQQGVETLVNGHRASEEKTCGGELDFMGFGRVSLVNAAYNIAHQRAGYAEGDGYVWPHMSARTYFATSCSGDGEPFLSQEYAAVHFLGRSLRYTVDLSGAGCGCNAALYLTSMHQNADPSECGDFYCDANEVCGVRCAEVDIQEANTRSWLTTLHTPDDNVGFGGGYGADRTTWNDTEYGPGAICVDTRMPFSVTASFPVDVWGILVALEVTLTQPGKPCSVTTRIDGYQPFGARRNGLVELTEALRAGMTPIISYWGMGEDLSWMDGRGPTGLGPCDDGPMRIASCADLVKFSDFVLM